MIYIPIIASLAFALTTLFEKVELVKKKINSNHFVVAVFLAAVICMIPFLYFLGRIDSQAFDFENIIILGLIVFFTILANLSYFYAIKWEKITTLEPGRLLEPLFVILLAFAFFKAERDMRILIPASIAAIALILPHIKKHHLNFNKYVLLGVFGSLFYAIEILLAKILLEYYSPISLYFTRCLFVLIIVSIIFRPNLIKELKTKDKLMALLIGALWVVFRVLAYYGYFNLGIIYTTLILMLTPIFVYAFAYFFLKEKPNWKNIVAAVVILACILYVTLF